MELDLGLVAGLLLLYMMFQSTIAKANAATAAANAAPVTSAAQVAIAQQQAQTAQDAITAGEINAGTSAAYNLLSDFF